MLTRTQALEGGANVTFISKVQFAYRSSIRLTILSAMLHRRRSYLLQVSNALQLPESVVNRRGGALVRYVCVHAQSM